MGDRRPGVEHLEVGFGSDAAEIGDVVLGAEVAANDLGVGEQRPGVCGAERGFEPGDDADVAEPHIYESRCALVELLDRFNHWNDDPGEVGVQALIDVVVKPRCGRRVDAHEHGAALTHDRRRERSSVGAPDVLLVDRGCVFTVDDHTVGPAARQLGNEVFANGRSKQNRPETR